MTILRKRSIRNQIHTNVGKSLLVLLTSFLAWDALSPSVPLGSSDTGWIFNLDAGYNARAPASPPRIPEERNHIETVVDMLTHLKKHGPVKLASFAEAGLSLSLATHTLDLLLRSGLVTMVHANDTLYELSDKGARFLGISESLRSIPQGPNEFRVLEIRPFEPLRAGRGYIRCETCESPARKEVHYETEHAIIVKRFCDKCVLSDKHLNY